MPDETLPPKPPLGKYTRQAHARGASHRFYVRTIKEILKEYPDLTACGFGILSPSLRGAARKAEFDLYRNDLFTEWSEEAFWASVAFISTLLRTRTTNLGTDSYALKHAVERWTEHSVYISNGVFIAAASYSGLRVERGGINAFFNISSRRPRPENE